MKTPQTLRDIWREHISADDYERHMAAAGQAQANAALLEELFREHAPRLGAHILFAGAGTGQYLDYLPGNTLDRYHAIFTDINAAYLARLSARCRGADFATAVDDIEEPHLAGPFDLAIAILVLEHVNWRKASASLAAQAARVFVIVQQNHATSMQAALPGTLAILRDNPPTLIAPEQLISEFESHGFELIRLSARPVPDRKTMIALDFRLRK